MAAACKPAPLTRQQSPFRWPSEAISGSERRLCTEMADMDVVINAYIPVVLERRFGSLALFAYTNRWRSNCCCDVSTLTESWKIMHSLA